MSRIHDSERKNYRKPAAAIGALMATVLLAACGSNTEASPSQTNNTTPTATSSATPGASESSSSPNTSVSASPVEVHYTGKEMPPISTNYQEAKAFTLWSLAAYEKSNAWDVLENHDASWFIKNKIGKPEVQASLDYYSQMADFSQNSGYLKQPASNREYNLYLRQMTANKILMQSILDDPAIADKLATTVEPITQAEYTARMNTDPTSFFSTMFRYATNDTSIIPIELTTGGKVGVSDVQIKNYVESHMPANATEATLPGILFNITGQELTYSSMFKLLGHDNNPTYKTFEDSSS